MDLTCLMIAVCASLAGSGFVSPLRESVTTDPPSAPSGSMLVRSVLTVSLYVVMLNMFPTQKRRVSLTHKLLRVNPTYFRSRLASTSTNIGRRKKDCSAPTRGFNLSSEPYKRSRRTQILHQSFTDTPLILPYTIEAGSQLSNIAHPLSKSIFVESLLYEITVLCFRSHK